MSFSIESNHRQNPQLTKEGLERPIDKPSQFKFSSALDNSKNFPNNLIEAVLNRLTSALSPATLAAYRAEGEIGHGTLIIKDGAEIQGYVADMPDNFDTSFSNTDKRTCKRINEDEAAGHPATVCIGSDNQIPPEGDIDFVAVEGEWYKIRSGTAIVANSMFSDKNSITPKGVDMWSSYGAEPQPFKILPDFNRGILDNISDSVSVVHKADESPYPWDNPHDALKPIVYLNRLHEESDLGPLPVPPPSLED